MSRINWGQLGPREKEILAIIRRADTPLTSREVLGELRVEGEDVAYTTVSTILGRLVEKGLLSRSEEVYQGSPRYRHRFDVDDHRNELVESVVEDVADVLGEPGLTRLAVRAREWRRAGIEQQPTEG